MKKQLEISLAAAGLILAAACTTTDKAATPADTLTAQPTTIAPANSSAPVVAPAAPVDTQNLVAPSKPGSVKPVAVKPATRPTTTKPKSTGTPTAQPTERDSVIRPRGTVDANGNITPIKRDTLK